MKAKALTPAEKGKKTKLSKKSVEELVNIIFRKDDIEKQLRLENNNMSISYNKLMDTYKNHRKEYFELKDKYEQAVVSNNCKNVEIDDYKYVLGGLKKVLWLSGIFNIVFVLIIIVLLFIS